jgi:ribosomal protein S12 methylthiotransferase accessory factor YcaO
MVMVALMATVLCTDRLATVAPALRHLSPVELARTFAGRMAERAPQAAARVALREYRQGRMQPPAVPQSCAADSRPAVHVPGPRHQYRLPPPTGLFV